MKNPLWVLRAIMLGVIVLGALFLDPQPLLAQEGVEVVYFTPSSKPITIVCDGNEVEWQSGSLQAQRDYPFWEVRVEDGWCRMPAFFTLEGWPVGVDVTHVTETPATKSHGIGGIVFSVFLILLIVSGFFAVRFIRRNRANHSTNRHWRVSRKAP